MHRASFAEWILSLVTTPDRASSTVGDLMEDVSARGWRWFWLSIFRTAASMLWRSFAVAPISILVIAGVAWFGYMSTGLILWFVAQIMMTVAWGLPYFFSHHTGLELLSNLLKVRLDWAPAPPHLAHWIEALMILINAPYHVGRFTARACVGREIVVWMAMALLWPMLAVFVPFAATSIRVSFPMMVIVLASSLIGVLRERRAILV